MLSVDPFDIDCRNEDEEYYAEVVGITGGLYHLQDLGECADCEKVPLDRFSLLFVCVCLGVWVHMFVCRRFEIGLLH